jgi:hypothetical protein
MTKLMFTIYDSVSEIYEKPLVARTKGEFLRDFARAVNDPNTTLAQNPADFTCFLIGEWDDVTGAIKMYDAKINLGLASEYKSNTENPEMGPADSPRLQNVEKLTKS